MKQIYSFIVLAMFGMNIAVAQNGATCVDAIQINSNPSPNCVFSSHQITGAEYWLKFLAVSSNVNIEIFNTFKWGTDAPHAHKSELIGGTCANPQVIAEDELPFIADAEKMGIELSAELVIGNIYYIKISRQATGKTCDKSSCYPVINPAAFDICIEETDFYIPPDLNLEPASGSHAYYKSKGQVVDTDGNPRFDIKAYTVSSSPAAYYFDNKVSYVYASIDTNPVTLDTLHRVDMTLYNGEMPTMKKAYLQETTQGYLNYFLGHVRTGITKVRGFQRIVYTEVYPNIDFHVYSNAKGLKYYFVIKPGGDADQILMNFTGQDNLTIDGNGGLNIETSIGTLRFEFPHAYKINPQGNPSGMPQPVYVQPTNGIITFGNIGNVPPNFTLVIGMDEGHIAPQTPTNNWFTYIGGPGEYEAAYSATTDVFGNFYVTGQVQSGSTYFPATVGVVQTQLSSIADDAFAAKFNDADSLIWATYYGGDFSEQGRGIVVDNLQNVYFTGYTMSPDFPIKDPGGGAYYQDTIGVSCTFAGDAFIVKLNPSGTDNPWATFYGGCKEDMAALNGIALDDSGNVYICGKTESQDFPLYPLAGAYNQGTLGGNLDGFVAKFTVNGLRLWSSYFGGGNYDLIDGIAINDSGDVYITGETRTPVSGDNNLPPCGVPGNNGFPLCDPVGGSDYYQGAYGGVADAFITRFSSSGELLWSSYFGGDDEDGATGIAVNRKTVGITGYTRTAAGSSTNTPPCSVPGAGLFPTCNPGGGAYFEYVNQGIKDGFVARFNEAGELIWSSMYGGNQFDIPRAITFDALNNLYVTGNTNSPDFPVKYRWGMFYEWQFKGGTDAFVIGFDSLGGQRWATYYGGNGTFSIQEESGHGITAFSDERLYVVGVTNSNSSGFPYDCNPAIQYCRNMTDLNDKDDGFIARFDISGLLAMEENKITAGSVLIYPNPTAGEITLEFDLEGKEEVKIKIYNVLGKQVYEESAANMQGRVNRQIDLSSFSNGIYFIRVEIGDRIISNKIVKQY